MLGLFYQKCKYRQRCVLPVMWHKSFFGYLPALYGKINPTLDVDHHSCTYILPSQIQAERPRPDGRRDQVLQG